MYDIEGSILEQHGQYHCDLKVWRNDHTSKELVVNGWHKELDVSDAATEEHDIILDVLVSVLHRIAEEFDRKLPGVSPV